MSKFTVTALRSLALDLFRLGVAKADPASGVRTALREQAALLLAARHIHVAALGKAAVPMMRAALPFVSDRIGQAVAVTNADNVAAIAGVTVRAGGHPLPDAGSVAGADAIEALATAAEAGDLVLVLVSGGGSALVCAPAPGLALEDKIALNHALIRSGADITEINLVRSAVSRLKGGGLARAAAPAQVLALILSDVPGDDPATIASGPTVKRGQPDAALRAEAHAVLARHDLLQSLPDRIGAHLSQRPQAMTAREGPMPVNILIGSNALSVAAISQDAGDQGWRLERLDEWLDGDVADAALRLHNMAQAAAAGRVAIVCGGETTVRVTGTGLGGRNQELALRFALLGERVPLARDWVFLSGGTDGRDGPTDAAGGVVDAGTLARIRSAGLDPAVLLANNDAYRALDAAGDLIRTGATGTNVADIQVLLLA